MLFKSLGVIITTSLKCGEQSTHSMVIVSWVDFVLSWGAIVTEMRLKMI